MKNIFNNRAARFMKTPTGIALGVALLGTTSLMSPFITSTLGTALAAGTALGLSLNVLINSSALLLRKTKLFGRAVGVSTALLGAGLGIIASVPEFATSVSSIMKGTGDLGIGTIVGGNVAHIFLILGATAALGGISHARGHSWKFNAASMAIATLGFSRLLATNNLNPATGYGLLAASLLYAGGRYAFSKKDSLNLNIPLEHLMHDHSDHDHNGHGHHHPHNHGHDHAHDHKHKEPHHGYKSFHTCEENHDHRTHTHTKPRLFPIKSKPAEPPAPAPKPDFTRKDAGLAALGTAGLLVSAAILPDAAVTLSSLAHIDKAAIGAIVLGLATSAPELSMNIQAALDKDTDFVVSNILACNLAGILFVGSALALSNTPVPATFTPDSPLGLFNLAALGTSATLMAATLWANKGGIKRWQGFGAMALYGAYMVGSYSLGHTEPKPEPLPVVTTAKTQAPTDWLFPGPANAA